MANRLLLPPAANVAAPDPSRGDRASARTLLAAYAFLHQESQGIFILPGKVTESSDFYKFIEAVFQRGYCLQGLNYKNFMALLSDLPAAKANYARLILATALVPLSPSRELLYQGELTITRQEAMYDFTLQADSRGVFAKGIKPPSAKDSTRNLDEFVAVLWKRGLRFGLDLEAVNLGLAVPKNQYLRLTIARNQPPIPGADAKVEAVMSLEKDLRPLESPEGEVDLRRYQCVFPQARLGQVILRKIPATPGREGRTMAGGPIPTKAGKDLDLKKLAGSGTEIKVMSSIECLVAAQPGFVSRHPGSGAVSVTDEVINHTPVGIKTGSLTIEAERCLQFGGVQPGYQLEGNNLTLKSGAVEGEVISRRGLVNVEDSVAGGRVTALGGDIAVRGRVLAGSSLEAYRGRITADYVERCTIIAREVEVRRAVNSVIIAEQATVAECMGSGIFAFGLKVGRTLASPRSSETGTSLVVPIIEPPRRPVTIIKRTIRALVQPLPEMEAAIEKIGADPHVQRYLHALAAYQQAKSEAQAEGALAVLTPLEEKVRPIVEHWRALKEQRAQLLQEKASLESEKETWLAKIKLLEEDLQGSMHLAVGSVYDDHLTLKLYKDPRLPAHFSAIAALDPERRRQFEALCRRMLSALASGHTKQCVEPIRGAFKATYRELMALLDVVPDRPAEPPARSQASPPEPGNRRREKRLVLMSREDLLAYLGDTAKKTPPRRHVLKVRVDELLEGYVNDFSGLGLGLFFDRQQRYAPVFEKAEKISLEFSLGPVTLEAEMVVTGVSQGPRIVRVGGFFVNLSPAQQALVYKVKNALEVRLQGAAAGDEDQLA